MPGDRRSRPPRPEPTTGSWPVDTGRAELVPDGDGRRGWTLLVNGVPSSHVDLDDPSRRLSRCGYRPDNPERTIRGVAAS